MISAVVGVSVVATDSVNDIFTLPKLVVMVLTALSAMLAVVWRLSTTGRVDLPRGRVVPLFGAVVVVMAVATLLGDLRLLSVVGEYGRLAGLLAFTAALVLLLATSWSINVQNASSLATACAVATGVVFAYGLLEVAGTEPLGLTLADQPVVSLLGQANYLGGFLGIGLPFLLWFGLVRLGGASGTAVAAVALLAALLIAEATESFQAWFSIAVGFAVFATVYLSRRVPGRRLAAGLAVVIGVTVLGAAVANERLEAEVRSGLDERVLMWQTAGELISERPLLGWGPSGYAAQFSAHRPDAHAERFGLTQLVDVPHSVPLAMFVSGGVVLGMLYLAFVVGTGLALVRGLRRTEGQAQLLLAAFGSGWAAYQVQSLISIDTPVLVVWHVVTAGAILALASTGDRRTWAFDGLRATRRGRKEEATTAGWLLRIVAGVVALATLVLLFRGVTADAAYSEARDLRASGDDGQLVAALENLERATSRAPWFGEYWAIRAQTEADLGDQDAAVRSGIEAAKWSPSKGTYALSLAQFAQRLGDDELARRWYEHALRNAPNEPNALNAAAEYALTKENYERAIELELRALKSRPDEIQYLILLGRAYEGSGEGAKAREAWERILDLRPWDPTAREALDMPPCENGTTDPTCS